MDTTYLKMTAPILSSFDSFLGYIALEPPSWINQCRLAVVPLVACAWGSGTVYLYVGSRGQEVTVFWWATISLTFIITAKTIVILASSNTLDRTRHFPGERRSLLAFTSPGFVLSHRVCKAEEAFAGSCWTALPPIRVKVFHSLEIVFRYSPRKLHPPLGFMNSVTPCSWIIIPFSIIP
jgi:hypothetical protein